VSGAVLRVAALGLAIIAAACPQPPPPAPEPGRTSRVGDFTVVTSGSVRVEGGYAR